MTVNIRRLRSLGEQLRNLMETAAPTRPAAERVAADGRSWYRIEDKAAGPADVYLYDMIGEWGVTAQDFVGDLNKVKSSAINLHINCEGGEVFDGLAIYEALRTHPAEVTAVVDGLAASCASFILQAADRRIMSPRARVMIHDAHGLAWGNATEMRRMADLLDDLSANIADIYADRAGGTRASWRTAMQAAVGGPDGTWYNADDAVSTGLADEVAEARSRGDEDKDGGSGGNNRAHAAGGAGVRNQATDPDGLEPFVPVAVREQAEANAFNADSFLAMINDFENPEVPAPPVSVADLLAVTSDLG